MRVDKTGLARIDAYVVLFVEAAAHRLLLANDALGALAKLRELDLGRDDGLAKERVRIHLGHAINGEPQSLAGNRAQVRAGPANFAKPFDDCDLFAVFPGLHGRPFASGAGADDYKIELVGHAVLSRDQTWSRSLGS